MHKPRTPLKCKLIKLTCALTLVGMLALGVLWVRSYYYLDGIKVWKSPMFGLSSWNGGIRLGVFGYCFILNKHEQEIAIHERLRYFSYSYEKPPIGFTPVVLPLHDRIIRYNDYLFCHEIKVPHGLMMTTVFIFALSLIHIIKRIL